MELKDIIPNLNKPVRYSKSTYILRGSVVRKTEQGQLYYTAELLDKNKRSLVYADLSAVELEKTNEI